MSAFARRDRLVTIFRTTPDQHTRERVFNLIVRINALLLHRGRREAFARSRL